MMRLKSCGWCIGLALALFASASLANDPPKVNTPDTKDTPKTPKVDEPTKEEQRLLELTNAERQRYGLGALIPDPVLMRLAREQSATMARYQVLSHDLEGRSFGLRLAESRYPALNSGENCAEGVAVPEGAIQMWMASPGHQVHMLGDFTHLGVGIVTSAGGRKYYTQVFAKAVVTRAAPMPTTNQAPATK